VRGVKNAVCFITQSQFDFDPRIRRKAMALVASGYTVDVLAIRSSNGKARYLDNGVNVRTIALGKKRGSIPRYLYEYAVFFMWALFCVTVQGGYRRYAIVDVNTLPDFLIFSGVFVKWMGAKLVLDMHEITPEFFMSKYGIKEDSWTIRFIKFVEKISFGYADHVITISDPVQNLLVSRGLDASRATVITNAADDSRFAASVSFSRQRAMSDSERFIMMYHGTLTHIYGLDLAIEAFARVHKQMPQAEIWILGGGPESNTLNSLIQKHDLAEKVRMIGMVPSTEIPAWLSQCDVGILPIRRDCFLDYAFPNKLPEFIVMGKAAIVSRLRAIQYYFDNDAIAYFEPNSVEDLSEQMLRLYCDPDLRSRLAQLANEEYVPISWKIMRQRYLELVHGLSGNVNPAESAAAVMTHQRIEGSRKKRNDDGIPVDNQI